MSTLINQINQFLKIRSVLLRIFCLGVIFIPSECSAQTIQLGSTIGGLIRQKPTPAFKWDTQNSFITGKSVKVQSLKAGVTFGSQLTLGVGYHWLQSDITQEVKGFTSALPMKMRYMSLFGEFVFYNKGNWEGIIPIQFGYGHSFLQTVPLTGKPTKLYRETVFLYEPNITIEYKFSPWIGIGAGYGYRIMLKNNPNINQNFYAPLYVFRMRILFGELYSRYGHLFQDEME